MTAERPNVLFIICDDLNDAVEGLGGHPQTKTPNITRIMSRGVTFLNNHCNAPVCAPSRDSLWSGLYPHTTGQYGFDHWKNNAVLRDTVMMQEHFRNHGYEVLGTGKLFHNSQEDPTLYDRFGHAANFGPWPWDGRLPETHKEHPDMSYLIDTNPEIRTHWEQTFGPLSNVPNWAPDPEERVPGYTGWRLYNAPFCYIDDEQRDLMPDERSARWAASRLTERHTSPFFLAVGFNRPHTPLYAPQAYFDRFPLSEIELPPYKPDDLDDAPPIVRELFDYAFARFELVREAGGVELWKRWIQAYLACVNFVDDQVGLVLDALEASDAADDTIIVFTGDNGYHMGEKNALFKGTLWEESTRVPLIISAPGVGPTGATCNSAVSLVHLYPTLIDLCGLPADPNAGGHGLPLDGTSLRPLLQDPQAGAWDGPPVALSAYQTKASVIARHGPEIGEGQFTVRGDRWRYTRYGEGSEELFDHQDDPHEWENRAGDEDVGEAQAAMKARFDRITPRPVPGADEGEEGA
jgi:arylsulfatase A-like enzyme